jgi:hypothetical protein
VGVGIGAGIGGLLDLPVQRVTRRVPGSRASRFGDWTQAPDAARPGDRLIRRSQG